LLCFFVSLAPASQPFVPRSSRGAEFLRNVPQNLTELFSRGRNVAVSGANDPDRKDFRGAGKRPIDESFSGHLFQHRRGKRNAATTFNRRDE
jgi:hypothetical protein